MITILAILAPVILSELLKRIPAARQIPKVVRPWVSAAISAGLTQIPRVRDILGNLSPQEAATLGLAGAGVYAGGAQTLLQALRISPRAVREAQAKKNALPQP